MASGLLEVIALSVEDARAAERGGAGRVELVRELDREGLTPAFELAAAVVDAVAIPVRVMLREREPFDGHSAADLDALARVAASLVTLRLDGVVLGFLREGRVDLDAVARVLEAAPELRATFHRAFEAAQDQQAALVALGRETRIDRVLATGGTGPWEARAERLARLAQAAPPSITPVAAAGVDEPAIRLLRRVAGLMEFHVGRAAREEGRLDRPVVEARVAALARAVRSR
jgi:copper homeostasis protein